MAEDASLDDFLSGTGDEPDESDEPDEPDEPEESESADEAATGDDTASGDEPDPASVETPSPATTTYAWNGDGVACESCEAVVERRWQQDGTLVCGDCKVWDA